jgi:hypothetical protein
MVRAFASAQKWYRLLQRNALATSDEEGSSVETSPRNPCRQAE